MTLFGSVSSQLRSDDDDVVRTFQLKLFRLVEGVVHSCPNSMSFGKVEKCSNNLVPNIIKDFLCQCKKPYLRGRFSTIDLLVLTSYFLIVNDFFLLNRTSYFNEEVDSTEPSP
jgi:hypothetical protein